MWNNSPTNDSGTPLRHSVSRRTTQCVYGTPFKSTQPPSKWKAAAEEFVLASPITQRISTTMLQQQRHRHDYYTLNLRQPVWFYSLLVSKCDGVIRFHIIIFFSPFLNMFSHSQMQRNRKRQTPQKPTSSSRTTVDKKKKTKKMRYVCNPNQHMIVRRCRLPWRRACGLIVVELWV